MTEYTQSEKKRRKNKDTRITVPQRQTAPAIQAKTDPGPSRRGLKIQYRPDDSDTAARAGNFMPVQRKPIRIGKKNTITINKWEDLEPLCAEKNIINNPLWKPTIANMVKDENTPPYLSFESFLQDLVRLTAQSLIPAKRAQLDQELPPSYLDRAAENLAKHEARATLNLPAGAELFHGSRASLEQLADSGGILPSSPELRQGKPDASLDGFISVAMGYHGAAARPASRSSKSAAKGHMYKITLTEGDAERFQFKAMGANGELRTREMIPIDRIQEIT